MKLTKRLTLIFLISFACIGCDQGTKILASNYLPKHEIYSYLNDTFRISYAENHGAFLSLGSTLSDSTRFWLLTVSVGVFLTGLFFYMIFSRKLDKPSIIGFSLMFAGGTSNLYDRAMNNGAVIDFLNLGIGSLRTGIFNIADMYIMLGAAILIFAHTRLQRTS